MNCLGKSLAQCLLVFVGGLAAWIGVVSLATQSSVILPPALFVTLTALSVCAFGVVSFSVYAKSVAGVPFEDEHAHRRPSMFIPTATTIAFMLFIFSYATNHQAIWAMV